MATTCGLFSKQRYWEPGLAAHQPRKPHELFCSNEGYRFKCVTVHTLYFA